MLDWIEPFVSFSVSVFALFPVFLFLLPFLPSFPFLPFLSFPFPPSSLILHIAIFILAFTVITQPAKTLLH